jgi:hypothetical protein
MGAVAKSYMRKGLIIHEKMRKYLVIYEEAVSNICMTLQPFPSGFPYRRGKLFFLFYQCVRMIPSTSVLQLIGLLSSQNRFHFGQNI